MWKKEAFFFFPDFMITTVFMSRNSASCDWSVEFPVLWLLSTLLRNSIQASYKQHGQFAIIELKREREDYNTNDVTRFVFEVNETYKHRIKM
jgi:hypothetical protein